jgi:hypothetical protein
MGTHGTQGASKAWRISGLSDNAQSHPKNRHGALCNSFAAKRVTYHPAGVALVGEAVLEICREYQVQAIEVSRWERTQSS